MREQLKGYLVYDYVRVIVGVIYFVMKPSDADPFIDGLIATGVTPPYDIVGGMFIDVDHSFKDIQIPILCVCLN